MPKSRGHCTRGALPAKYLKILHWNIGGILSDTYGNKLDDPDFLNVIKDKDKYVGYRGHYRDISSGCATYDQ